MSNISDIVQAIREAPTPGVARELLTSHIQKEHERAAETCDNLRTRIQQFQQAINRIAGHVSACCAGVDVEDSNGLGSHTSEEIIRRIDALVAPHTSLKERTDTVLHFQYSKDSIESLYEMCNMLPACNMFGALSGVIQDLQFYQQEHLIASANTDTDALRTLLHQVADETFQMARRSFLDNRVALKPDIDSIINGIVDRKLGG